jgi:mycothiol synthase
MDKRMNNILPEGFTFRPPNQEDAESIVALCNADSRHLYGIEEYTVEEMHRGWNMPRVNMERDMRVVVAPDGQIASYYEVWDLEDPHTTVYVWGRVHPDYTGRGIGSYQMEWAEERARQAIRLAPPQARVVMWVSTLDIDHLAQELFDGYGFQRIRSSLRMVIEFNGAPPPHPVWPEGITLRTVVRGQDEFAAWAAGREAFRDHFGFVERPIEEEYERWASYTLNDPDYDPSLWFVAMDGDQIAGNSMCRKNIYDDPELGWVSSLSVKRPWRKRGLGLALLLHSFGEFYRRGYHKVGLGVDAENLTGALRLYEKAGMHSDPLHAAATYEKELRPGRDWMNRG